GLLPALRAHDPLSFALRSPDVLGALDKVINDGGALTAEFSERVPIERRFEVQIPALDVDGADPRARHPILLFFRDLTPAWRIERMRTDFVASASHELRTPLAAPPRVIETLEWPGSHTPE